LLRSTVHSAMAAPDGRLETPAWYIWTLLAVAVTALATIAATLNDIW
jgi:hypothetical protein